LDAFWESVRLDWARGPALRGKGPAITNLVHMEALGVGASPAAGAGAAGQDPVPLGREALAQRPDATMLRRLMLDVELDRRTTGASTGRAGADAARVNTLRNRR
jgi:hypothetical protein